MTPEYKDMSELLESDRAAMAFYNSLPISLQQKIYRGGVGAFAEIYNSAGKCPTSAAHMTSAVNIASATECTGSVPSGEVKSTGLLKAD